MTEEQAEKLVDGLVAVIRKTSDHDLVVGMIERIAPCFDDARMTDALMVLAAMVSTVILESQAVGEASPSPEIVCGVISTIALEALDAYAERVTH